MDYAVIVAGGTGGHINSAIALGEKFEKLSLPTFRRERAENCHGSKKTTRCQGSEVLVNLNIEYISGRKNLDFQLFDRKNCQHVFSYALMGKNPLFILKSLSFNFLTLLALLLRFLMKRPTFVFGVGGYVCGPALLAAYLIGVPVFILEQNSVLGLTNRFLSKISRIIFVCFHSVKGLAHGEKVRNYGNPLREEFYLSKFNKSRNALYDAPFRLLVFGGSLGSQEINRLLVDLLGNYNLEIKISVLHQTGRNKVDIGRIPEKIDYKQREYLDHIVQEYQKSDFIICRGGASTISELRVVKRPTLIIPIRFHRDQHQIHNAYALKKEVGFPVYVDSVEELAADKCRKLQSLIQREYKRKAMTHTLGPAVSKGEHDETHNESSRQDPSTLIVGAVLENV